MTDEKDLSAVLAIAYGEVVNLPVDELARLLEGRAQSLAHGEPLATGIGDLPEQLTEWFKDLLRGAGSEGASIWKALGDPETRHQMERMTHLGVVTIASVQGLHGWTPAEVMTLLVLVASFLQGRRPE